MKTMRITIVTKSQERSQRDNHSSTACHSDNRLHGGGSQMVIPHGTVDQLHNEGISVVSDLIDFDKSIIKKISSNLFCPVGRIADPDTGAAPGAAIPAPPFVFGA